MTKIAVLVGSLRADSMNKKLADTIESFAPSGVEFVRLDISEVPVFNQDLEADVPESVKTLKADIEAADGVLFVTPEYNRGMPGVLKNAIDWASRPYGDNSFSKKPVGVVGSTSTPWGTIGAQFQLKTILSYLNTRILGQPEVYIGAHNPVFDEAGNIHADAKEHLSTYIKTLVEFVAENK